MYRASLFPSFTGHRIRRKIDSEKCDVSRVHLERQMSNETQDIFIRNSSFACARISSLVAEVRDLSIISSHSGRS